MVSKYLVTGGAGFIGSCVARALIDKGNEVWIIDNLSTGYVSNIPNGAKFVQGDCQDIRTIEALGETRFDAILHIAGQSSGEISFDDPVYDLRTNTESSLLLMKYGLRTGSLRFIYASSMSVYGKVEDAQISESHECKPLSFYGVGKLASEHYMRIYQPLGILPTSLRLFNVYGPGQNMENLRQGMVSIYLAQLFKNDKILVKGGCDRFRDFIYIDDEVKSFLVCLDNIASIGAIYNVATGRKTTVAQLLDLLKNISGIDKPIEIGSATPGDQKGIYADISKIERELGFKPKHTLEKGLNHMIEWMKTIQIK